MVVREQLGRRRAMISVDRSAWTFCRGNQVSSPGPGRTKPTFALADVRSARRTGGGTDPDPDPDTGDSSHVTLVGAEVEGPPDAASPPETVQRPGSATIRTPHKLLPIRPRLYGGVKQQLCVKEPTQACLVWSGGCLDVLYRLDVGHLT
ncbi:unnamed protein product [Diplocarpon coronariae]